ncbi:helix-turn-helix domain-containing protein [Streptomyces sp. NPDC002763]|uniref:helix-turn-helix domain-containing protein n=1 Tax=Streptomyces sp. NPDC002763 TaxID=3154427 RepID=UPI00332D1CE0
MPTRKVPSRRFTPDSPDRDRPPTRSRRVPANGVTAHPPANRGPQARRPKRELVRTDRPIAEIAAKAGFADQSRMTGMMRRHKGITPRMLRAGDHGRR